MRVPLAFLAAIVAIAPWLSAAAEPWIAVIVPLDSKVDEVQAETISLIFRRIKLYWGNGARVQPVNLPADSPLRRRFSRAILKQSPEALDDYWNQLYFQGVLPPHVVASQEAVLRFVAETADAVGYVDACAVDTHVRTILLIDADLHVLPPGSAPNCEAAPR